MKQKMEKWERWLDVIYKDVIHQAGSRAVFQETVAIINGNPQIPKDSDFLEFLEQWHADSVLMGLRRQLKINSDSISLIGLLDDIANNASLVSRKRFISLYPGTHRNYADRLFDQRVGSNESHVDACAVRAEIDQLRRLAGRCEELADRRIAHRDKRATVAAPTWKELNQAGGFAQDLLRKYSLLLRGRAPSVIPTFPHPWKRVFEVAWKPRGTRLTSASSRRADARG